MASPDTTHPYLTRRAMLRVLAGGALTFALPSFLGGCRRAPMHDAAEAPLTAVSSHTAPATQEDLAAIIKAAHIRRPEDGILLLQKGVPIDIIKQMDWDAGGDKDKSTLRVLAEGYRLGKIKGDYTYSEQPWKMAQRVAESDPFCRKSIGGMRRSLIERINKLEHATRTGCVEDAAQLKDITNPHQLTLIKRYCDHFDSLDWEAFGKATFPNGYETIEHGGPTIGDESVLRLVDEDTDYQEQFEVVFKGNKKFGYNVPKQIRYAEHIGMWHSHVPFDAKIPEENASPTGQRAPYILQGMPILTDTSGLAYQNTFNPFAVNALITILRETPRLYNVDLYLRNALQSDDNPQHELRWENAKDVIVIDLGNYPTKQSK